LADIDKVTRCVGGTFADGRRGEASSQAEPIDGDGRRLLVPYPRSSSQE
jgi:hypothetical protein